MHCRWHSLPSGVAATGIRFGVQPERATATTPTTKRSFRMRRRKPLAGAKVNDEVSRELVTPALH
jgi:hypothetical protein